MKKVRGNVTGKCPGALALMDLLCALVGGDPNLLHGVKINIGHKTNPKFAGRVEIEIPTPEGTLKFTGWWSKLSTFNPQRFDEKKQKKPGTLVIGKWSETLVKPMSDSVKALLHSAAMQKAHNDARQNTKTHGKLRAYVY